MIKRHVLAIVYVSIAVVRDMSIENVNTLVDCQNGLSVAFVFNPAIIDCNVGAVPATLRPSMRPFVWFAPNEDIFYAKT
jgi:hypothetical protein